MDKITVEPNGIVYLCKSKIERDYKNELTFLNKEKQLEYFNSIVFKTYDNVTYIRRDNAIKVNENIDNIINCDYLFYRNNGFTDKYYYCFITNMTYVSENCTLINFETDVFQTWQFDIDYRASFIEREHVSDDTIGKHTVPENLETGEYIVNSKKDDTYLSGEKVIVLGTTLDPILDAEGNLTGGVNGGGIYGGVQTAYAYYSYNPKSGLLESTLRAFAKGGKLDGIGNMYMLPKDLVNVASNIDGVLVPNSQKPTINFIFSVNKPSNINGYVPKNNKLFTFPYCYMDLTNNSGINSIYHFEKFSTPECKFAINGVVCPSGSILCTPKDFNGVSLNYSESIGGGKFPICGFQNDVYTNWLTQNAINIPLKFANAGFSIASAFANKDVGSAVSGVNQIAGAVSEIRDHKLVPVQAEGNLNNGDINFALDNIKFSAYTMTIKKEYAEIIDNYFSMFGYKVNLLKTPNINTRPNWNYVKTLECNFTGNIPSGDLDIIKTIFNSGITLWHNPDTMYDYTQNNNI